VEWSQCRAWFPPSHPAGGSCNCINSKLATCGRHNWNLSYVGSADAWLHFGPAGGGIQGQGTPEATLQGLLHRATDKLSVQSPPKSGSKRKPCEVIEDEDITEILESSDDEPAGPTKCKRSRLDDSNPVAVISIATYMVRGVGGGVALIGCVRSGDGRVLQWLILALPASHFGHYSMFARSIHNVLIPIDSA